MPRKVQRLTKSVLEIPQLLMPSKFEEIAEYLDNRNIGELHALAEEANSLQSDNGSPMEVETSVGLLNVHGTLTAKSTGWEALCGGTSYESLLEQVDYYCSMENVNTILMNVSSGGGEAYQCFYTSRKIREKVDAAGKKLIGYIDNTAASAAYALVSGCHEIIADPDSSSIGSIGVVISLMNDSKALEDKGYKRTFITAGDSKVPFDAEGDFKEEFLSDLQESVNATYNKFVSHVADMRSLSEEDVRSTEAKVFRAEVALELGLVDKIMEVEEFYTYLADVSEEGYEDKKKPQKTPMFISASDEGTKEELSSDVISDETAEHITNDMSEEKLMSDKENLVSQEEFLAMQAELQKFRAQEVAREKQALSDTVGSFEFLAESKEGVVEFLMSDASDANKELLNAVLAEAQAHLTATKEEADSKIAEIKEEAASEVETAKAEAAEAKADAESAKEEFAAPNAESVDETKLIKTETSAATRQDAIDAKVAAIKAQRKEV